MATVFDLRDVFELVIDRFDDDPFAQEPLVRARDQAVFHIPLDGGKQLDPVSKELLKHPLGEIAFVAQQFPKESLRQVRQWLPVIHEALRDLAGEKVPAIIDDQVEFEPVKPAYPRSCHARPILRRRGAA